MIRTPRTTLVGLGGLTLTVVVALLTPAVSAASATAATTDSVILTGTLTDLLGNPASSGRVTVSVEKHVTEPVPGDVSTPIATAATGPDGQFTVTGELGAAPVDYNWDGTVRLEVLAETGADRKYFNVLALPPAAAGADWTWGPTADPNLLPAGATSPAFAPLQDLRLSMGAATATPQVPLPDSLFENPNAAPVGEALDANDPTNSLAEPDADAADAQDEAELAAADAAATAATKAVGSSGCTNVWQDREVYRKRYSQSQLIKILDRTRQTYDWRTSKETELQLAYSFEGKLKGKVPYAGGMSYARTHTSAASVGFDENAPWNGSVALQWRYQKQARICVVWTTPYTYETKDTGERRWVPTNFTGDHYWDDHYITFTCDPDYKARIEGTLTIQYGTGVFWDGWFELAGVKLDARQGSSESHTMSLRPKSSYQYARVCGYNKDPAIASAVREVPFT